MNIKIIDGQPRLYTRSVGRVESLHDLISAYYWRMRCRRHNRWIKLSQLLVKFLAMSLLKRSNIYCSHIKRYKRKPYIETLNKPYGTKCYGALKGEYNTDINHYIMMMKVSEFTFWGNTEYEIYLNIIKTISIRKFQYPYCVKGGVSGVINRMKHKNVED
ncbi:TPA: hypothetical protein GXZ34_01350 [bacterium]|nr:hypothetical protein [bacterium]